MGKEEIRCTECRMAIDEIEANCTKMLDAIKCKGIDNASPMQVGIYSGLCAGLSVLYERHGIRY